MTAAPILPQFTAAAEAIVGAHWVRQRQRDLLTYAYDATGEKHLPGIVVFPGSTAEVSALVKLARTHGVPVVARGAGTNLSGGTLPVGGGLVLALQRMNRLLSIDLVSRRAVVEPCITNIAVQDALAPHGFFYAPDPSSHRISTIGGNCQENAGGPHCVKYGVTTNHIRGVELVLADGTIVMLGGEAEDWPGYDLRGVTVGAEGTLGIVTKVVLNILPLPEGVKTILAVYPDLEACLRSVSEIIAARIVPAALELVDRGFIRVIQASMDAGYPLDAEAVLVIDVDGPPEGLAAQAERIANICRQGGAGRVELAATEAERDKLWQGRRAAYPSAARMNNFLWTMDITVPRNQLVEMMRAVLDICRRHGLAVYTAAHAGDGNLHPTIPFKPADPENRARVKAADREILQACVALGGSISGEHGIGVDKLEQMRLMYDEAALDLMRRIKRAFDPDDLMNPGKNLPVRIGGF